MSGAAPRVAAARVLDAVLHRGRSLKAELGAALPALADPRDRALVEAICFAALRQRARADAALSAWMPKPPGRRDGDLRALLHVGSAQLDPLGLAPYAAVGETVDAARGIGRAHQARLVNALLRRAQREGLPAAAAEAAWPQWLRDRVRADWGPGADAIFAASLVPGPTWLRVNRRRGDRDAYVRRLLDAGLESAADPVLPEAIRLSGSIAVGALPGFSEGDVSVQDGSAQAVADALAPPAGARVLDACAAPGGKSAHLLERDPTLRLLAIDVDATRLARVREGWRRLGVGEGVDPGAVARVADAAAPDTWWDGVPFDAVLVDAPCSATGVIRRQPDVLLHRRPADVTALVDLQARLLDAAWSVLAPGGVLLYATCSILADENSRQVDAFLERHPDAVPLPLDGRFGRASGAGRQRLPGEDGMDGFFYTRIARCERG
ncbi:MAG: 16S rRNA (cytosine(967)-C(5))-methyltransferase RsmB [Gammaproteobacteria bacterium]|nr:16S rRNA (cytosine(967)-C(5))-methyltransferase RsmB [Gammaproteobacteria bacterium]